jgi:hypothetical protein
MIGPIARILLRVLAGILIGKGWFAPEDANALAADPEVAAFAEMAIGGAIWAATEAYYYLAKRWGWAT